jgi:REP element-mobilizing transposase RayT
MHIEYFNLYTHYILSTHERRPLIKEKYRERIEKYITGIISRHHSKLYAIYANPDHVHMLISKGPSVSEEALIETIAQASESFIKSEKLCSGPFAWQESAAAFSVSKSDVDRVCKYILNQPDHHKKMTFNEEYEKFIQFYQHSLQSVK